MILREIKCRVVNLFSRAGDKFRAPDGPLNWRSRGRKRAPASGAFRGGALDGGDLPSWRWRENAHFSRLWLATHKGAPTRTGSGRTRVQVAAGSPSMAHYSRAKRQRHPRWLSRCNGTQMCRRLLVSLAFPFNWWPNVSRQTGRRGFEHQIYLGEQCASCKSLRRHSGHSQPAAPQWALSSSDTVPLLARRRAIVIVIVQFGAGWTRPSGGR